MHTPMAWPEHARCHALQLQLRAVAVKCSMVLFLLFGGPCEDAQAFLNPFRGAEAKDGRSDAHTARGVGVAAAASAAGAAAAAGGDAGRPSKWTAWQNHDDPTGHADNEGRATYNQDDTMPCDHPTAIECATRNGRPWNAEKEAALVASKGGSFTEACTLTGGLVCTNKAKCAQKSDCACPDYAVRYLCPAQELTASAFRKLPPTKIGVVASAHLAVCTCAKCGSTSFYYWMYSLLAGNGAKFKEGEGNWIQNLGNHQWRRAGLTVTPANSAVCLSCG